MTRILNRSQRIKNFTLELKEETQEDPINYNNILNQIQETHLFIGL